jgi:competence protein ComEA
MAMEKLKALIRNFFAFSRKETNAFLILLPLMALLIFSEPLYRYFFTHQKQDFSSDKQKLDSLVSVLKDSVKVEAEPTFDLKSFDPNKATQSELVSLGFSEGLAKRLVNYRSKGAKFILKKDLLKLYGMDNSLYNRLYPYIQLPDRLPDSTPPAAKLSKKLANENVRINLNVADTAQLKRVYGIGDKLSQRIIKYREKLGGFVSISQLKEVYGLDSTVVEDVAKDFFVESTFQPKKIKINVAKHDELANHPYINRALARAIEAYRFQHGNFAQLDDLRKVQLMKSETLQKLKPYLSFDP